MSRAFLACTAAVVVPVASAIAPAFAQSPPPPTAVPLAQTPAAAAPKKKVTPPGPNIAGHWAGQLTQVDNQTPLQIRARRYR